MASDFHLLIDEIKGESGDEKHKDEIEIDSFSWGVSNPGIMAQAGGGGSGKSSFNDLHVTTSVAKHSPVVGLSSATGKHIKKAVLSVRKAGGKQEDYYKVTLTDVLVSSYQSGGSGGSNALPTDSLSLNYAKIEFEYKPQKADGKLGDAIVFKYDLKANKAG